MSSKKQLPPLNIILEIPVNFEILHKYYDYELSSDIQIESEYYKKGSYKIACKIKYNDKVYILFIPPVISMNTMYFSDEMKIHIKLIYYYYLHKDTYSFKFNLPRIYKYNNNYVVDYISNTKCMKLTDFINHSNDKKLVFECGKFIGFCIYICKYIPIDVEILIDSNNQIYFIDYGNFNEINEINEINEYLSLITGNYHELLSFT